MTMEEKTRKAADLFEERTNERGKFFEIIDSGIINAKKDLLWQMMTAEELAILAIDIYQYARTTATKAVEENIRFIQETQKLGDYNPLPEYSVENFCQKYKAELVGDKIKVIPPKGIFSSSLKKYVDNHRFEIMEALKK